MAKDINDVIKGIQKKYGSNIIRTASAIPEVKAFPFGLPDLDLDLGGGVLMGRINMLAGDEASGKTSLAYQLAGKFQSHKIPVFWFDLEKSFDLNRAKVFGVTDENLFVIQSIRSVADTGEITNLELTAENVFEVVRDIIRDVKTMVDPRALFVLDSLNGMVIETLYETQANKTFQSNAKLNNQSFAVWQQLLDENQCFLIINQLRSSMSQYGDPHLMPGGEGQKYWSSQIVWLRDGQPIKEGQKVLGLDISWTVKKSRSSNPKERGTAKFYFQDGFDYYASLIHTALDLEILTKSGSWFVLPNGDRIQGEEKFTLKLKEDKQFLDNLEKEVYNKMPVKIWDGNYAPSIG